MVQPNRLPNRPTIGFLLASLHTGASRALWPGLLDAAEQHDANLISFPGGRLGATTAFENQRNRIFDLAGPACLDGLVTWASSLGGVLSTSETSAFHQRYQGLPMVSLAHFMEGLPTVALDSYQGMRALLAHLIGDHGYTKLAFVRGPQEHYYAQERYRAYLDTLQAYHLPLAPELVTRPLRWESGAEAVQILVDERGLLPGRDFEAVVAVSDLLALWALKSLQERGVEVPGEVAVTGFNNSIEERLATPPLTTVSLPFYQQGRRAVDLLLAQMHGETVPALLTLPSSLVIRQSCGCPSAAVQEAAYLPPPGGETLEPAEQRRRCLAEMGWALGNRDQAASESIYSGLLADLAQDPLPASSLFLKRLDEALSLEALSRPQPDQPDLSGWNGAVSALRCCFLPVTPPEKRAALEALFGQARVITGEAGQRLHAYEQWQAERQDEAVRLTNRALLTSFDIHQLGEVLAERLPGLGIPSAFLALQEGDGARLVSAYSEAGRVDLPPEGQPFSASSLLPPEYLRAGRRTSLVVEPLYFQEHALGYAVFENGPRDGGIYELMRDTLSSAIQGALLFDEIQRARLTAEKADRVKTRLLANVSHELRTPLNIILGYTQGMLAEGKVEPALQGEIRSIEQHAEHQLRVINDLLDLSRAEIDELDLALEVIDPRPLLEEAFHALADQAGDSAVTWRLEAPGRLPLVRADPVRLRQILLNLLSNARKFTESGQITLGAEAAPPYVHFWVSDTGPGIPAEQQERIFEPFVAVERDKQIAGGIGLGLSITRHLVTLHGGKMALESEPGRGSTFHFELPLPALDVEQTRLQEPQPALLLISASGQPSAEISALCARQNLKIFPAANPAELEAVLAVTQPMAIACDLSASQPDDWNMIRWLRRHPQARQAPFILYGQGGGEAAALGLTSFVVKAANRQSLLAAIEALSPPAGGGIVLIVDDEPQVRAELQVLAAACLPDCRVLPAADGETALALMEQEPPMLVLLDLAMPGLGGADVLDRMRADPRLRAVPVVVLSSKSLSQEDVRRLERHARVVFQSKGVWTEAEASAALHRALFGADHLPAHTGALVKRALAYLQQNYSRPLARWEIAAAVGVSEDYLTRVFNRELGISPWDYLTRYRVLHAKELLRTSQLSIGAVARAAGFKDQAYFSRVFSRHTGLSPQAYRANEAG